MDAAVATGTAGAGGSVAADGAAAAAAAVAAAVAPAQDAPISENPNQHEEDPVAAEVVAAAPWRCAPAPNGNAKGPGDAAKCVKCLKRYGKSTCSQLACIKCCTDIDGCEGHRALREERRRQEEILAGTSAVNVRAAKQRKMAVKPGAFPGEPSLRYLRESLVVWDCRQYLDNPKWRGDAIRRSERNKRAREVFAGAGAGGKAEEKTAPRKKEGRKRRFEHVMKELYEASVKV